MKLSVLSVFFYIFILFVLTCSEEDNTPPPPASVKLVEKTAEDSPVEHGIDAISEKDAIFLEWYANKEKNLAGYVIYRSKGVDENFEEIARITKRYNLIDTTFIDESVDIQIRYYYFVRAFDDFVQFSSPSDTVSYKLVEKPILSYPVGRIGANYTPSFIWDFDANFVPNQFVIRVMKKEDKNYVYYFTKLLNIIDGNSGYTPHQEWNFNTLKFPMQLTTGTYLWRIDPVGSEINQGGE